MSVLDNARQLAEEQEASAALTTAMDMEDDTEWVTDVYSQLNGTPARNGSTWWQRLNKYRFFITLVSLFLMGLGVALMVPRSNCVSSLLPSMGTDCAAVTTLSFIVAGLFCLTGLLGCLASYKGLRLSLSCCVAVLFFCYAVLCGVFAGYVVYSRLHQLENLDSAWRQLVGVHSTVVCDIQKTLQCSGFATGQCCVSAPWFDDAEDRAAARLREPHPCFFRALNDSTYDVNNGNEVTWPSAMCLRSCAESNEGTAVTCDTPLKTVVKEYFFRFVFVFTALAFLLSGLGCVTIAGMLWKPMIDSRMQHRF
ncbi:Tetraspanin family [Lotmaria passim]